jgi:hypothetical protein
MGREIWRHDMAHGGDGRSGESSRDAVGSVEGKHYVAAHKRGDHGRVVLTPAKEGTVTRATIRSAVEAVVAKRRGAKAR